jgi:hypothetical protein
VDVCCDCNRRHCNRVGFYPGESARYRRNVLRGSLANPSRSRFAACRAAGRYRSFCRGCCEDAPAEIADPSHHARPGCTGKCAWGRTGGGFGTRTESRRHGMIKVLLVLLFLFCPSSRCSSRRDHASRCCGRFFSSCSDISPALSTASIRLSRTDLVNWRRVGLSGTSLKSRCSSRVPPAPGRCSRLAFLC